MEPKIYAYRVRNHNLPTATRELNCDYGHFKCRVIAIYPAYEHDTFLVIVERCGSYPFIEDKWWKEFLN